MGLNSLTSKGMSSGLRWLWVSVLVMGLDFLSKIWVIDRLDLHETISFLPSLQLTYVRNYGVAFGQLTEQSPWLLLGLAGTIVVYLLYWLWSNHASKLLENLALCLIIGGAFGNLYDRVVYGYVVDFFDFYIGSWHWYIFNLADAAICVGAGLLLVSAFKDTQDPELS